MIAFYKKSEIGFAIAWIVIYVAVVGNLRNQFGDASIYTLLGLAAIAAGLTLFLARTGLWKKYGIVRVSGSRNYLYFLPFVLLCTVNLWFGIVPHFDLPHQIIAIAVMGLVGYVEEMIFRGLLFRAIEKENVTRAIIISAVTFGVGHIVNLLFGETSMDTVLQVFYAVAIGFSFMMAFYKSGSLIPCILTHSVFDIASTFSNPTLSAQAERILNLGGTVFLIVVAGGYSLYLSKVKPSKAVL